MEKPRIVTTSWDDGDYADLKLAELLRSKGVPGTFYLPISWHERPIDHSLLKNLVSQDFEIGAHGLSHRLLWRRASQDVIHEVSSCKSILEDIIGKEVRMFCYPQGRYDANVIYALKQAGYSGARTAS